MGYARNSGLEIAAGKFIAFVDSDDYVDLEACEKLYSAVMSTNAEVVYCSCRLFDEEGNIWMETNTNKEIQYDTNDAIRELILGMVSSPLNEKCEHRIRGSVWCALYRHDLIRNNSIQFKNERELHGGEDILFNIEYLFHTTSVIVIPDVLYNYRKNLKSLSNTVKSDCIIKNYFFYQCILDMLRTNGFGMEGSLRATKLLIENSRNDIRRYILLSHSKNEKMLWLKEVSSYNFWEEIASSFPYKQMSLKHVLQFYLLYKGYFRLLFYFSLVYYKIITK